MKAASAFSAGAPGQGVRTAAGRAAERQLAADTARTGMAVSGLYPRIRLGHSRQGGRNAEHAQYRI